MKSKKIFWSLLVSMLFSCADDQPFLSGFIKRAYDAVLTPCDPYGQDITHTCIVFSSANQGHLYVFDASRKEMILSPNRHWPLMIKVGKNTRNLEAVSVDKKSAWVLGLDSREPAIYSVRMFPSADKKNQSLENRPSQALPKKPAKMAAALHENRIIAVLSLPDEQAIQVLAINKDTGLIDQSIGFEKTLKVGQRPTEVGIIGDQVVIGDENANELFIGKLSELSAFLDGNILPKFMPILVNMPVGRLLLAKRDLGMKLSSYALISEAMGKKVSLIDIEAQKIVGSFEVDGYAMAFYFPDQHLVSFDNAKNWLSLVTAKGSLLHYSMEEKAGAVEFKKIGSPINLLSDTNLDLSTLQVAKIIGGTIEPDGKSREKTCLDNRQVFYVAIGNSKAYGDSDSFEVEAHSHACENDRSAARLGSEQSIDKYNDERTKYDRTNAPTFGTGI